MSAASLSVVVPVYRSASALRPLVERLLAALPGVAAEFEIILVNDGSPDNSWDLIVELAAADPRVRGINLLRNFGQHNALLCGIRAARGATIVTLDADLQHPPEEIQKLLARLAEGFDVVYGVPDKNRHGWRRETASRLIRKLLKIMGVETAGIGSSFRVFHTRLRDAFAEFHGPFVSIDVLLAWGTMRFTSVVVHHAARSHGRSSYSPARLLSHCFDVITGFSTLPLRLASWTGFFFTVFGIVVLIYVVGAFLILGYSVPGFPFLASIIAIFAGAQLFALGIIGEYIARMHFRLMDRPTYVVRQTAERQERETSNTEHPTPNAAPPAATSGPAGGRTLPPDSE